LAVTETDYATIVVSATHGKLGVVRNAQITSNTIQMIKVQFDFKTSDWDNLTKTAVFWRESDMADQNMDAKILMVLDNQGQCSIPPEMTVDNENTFLIGLYGVSSGTDLKRMVSNWIPFHVVRGCYGGGSASQAPTADVYEQLLSKLTYMAGTNVSIANNVISVIIPDTLATKTYVDEKSGKIDSIQVNGVPQTITNKAVNINIPTKTSQLSNDSNFVTTSYHDSTKSDITHNHDGIYLKEHQNISGKQDVIADLSAIRAGAALGATSLQELPEHIHTDEEITMSDFGANLRGFAQSALSSVNDLSYTVADLGDAVSDMNIVLGSKLSDAPSDGKQYARRNGAWEITSVGSSDYSSLTGKPSINNITLSGNKSVDELGIAEKAHTHTASDVGAFTQQSYSVVANTYINNTDGREIAYSGWDSTDYIELTGDQLKCVWNTSSTWNVFYDESKRYISSPTFGAGGATVIIPAQAKYVRLSNTSTAMRTLEVYALSSLTGMLDGISGRVKDIEDKESAWNSKQDVITDIDVIRSGAALGATALQSYTEIDPTVPNWAKQANKPTYTAAEIGALPSDTEIPPQMYYVITEDMFDINYNSTLGQSPYSTSYGYSEITISDDVGVEWKNGAVYRFALDTKIAKAPYRNVRVRIGENGTWIPITSYAGSASAQYGIFVKGHNTTFCYETKYISTGALTHMNYDTNTTYAYLANTVLGDATDSSVQIDSSGYGARYSLIFPTTPISSILDGTERWSSPMLSSSTSTSKKVFAGKLYLDRAPLYVYSANIVAGGKPINSLYQAYTNGALYSYLANTNSTYVTTRKRCYMWLKDFDEEELTFYADNTIGNVMSEDKITTRFPSSTQGNIYLLYLGWNNATWGNWQPDFVCHYRIYKYTPSTGVFVDTKISVG